MTCPYSRGTRSPSSQLTQRSRPSPVFADTGIIPLHFQISLWATRDGITYVPRVDEQTLAWKFLPPSRADMAKAGK